MKNLMLCLILICTASAWVMANDKDAKSDTRSVTGCLSQGDSAKEFKLTANDGSTWELKSDKVSLAEHVGHTVTATGVVAHATAHNMKEDAKDMAQDTGMKKDNRESGELKVTEVQMVSDSCSK